jgi:F-type H+-transporting ATPase subunit a
VGPHFTWVSVIPGLNAMPDHTATALIVVAMLFAWAILAKRQLVAAGNEAVVPDATLSARNGLEIFVDLFASGVEGILGPKGRQYVPLYGTFFLFILTSNLLGLIPGVSPPTSNINVTLALGLTSFVMYNYYGFRAHGGSYLKHFLGPVWWLAFLMLPLELIDNFLRPITLNLRLMMNMFADHLVLGIFTDLTRLVVPVVFLLLGTFVSVIQAVVFTLLSLVYVALAVGGHGEEHGH